MDKFIIAVFPDEAGAYAGLQKLKGLHTNGSLSLFRWAVVQKDSAGKLAVKDVGEGNAGNTIFGALLGGLVGVLGGPAGVAMGMSVGALAGAFGDLYEIEVAEDIVDQASRALRNGGSAVVAEVFETWVTPLDVEMEAAGGVVIRETRLHVETEKATREAEAARRELEQLRAEWAKASAERKAKLQASIDKAEAKLDASLKKIEKRLDQVDEDAERRISTLQAQVADAREETRGEITREIAQTRADLDARGARVKEAAALARKALSPSAQPEPV